MKIHSNTSIANQSQASTQHSPATPLSNDQTGPLQGPSTMKQPAPPLQPARIQTTEPAGRRLPQPPEPTQEQALDTLESFKREGRHPAYEISARHARREGWVRRGNAGGVALMAINNSYARQPHEPRIQVLYWRDEAAFAGKLYEALNQTRNCPHPAPGQAADIDVMLEHVQRCLTPLESFLLWCCLQTEPQSVEIQTSAAQPSPALPRRERSNVNPVRMVDQVNAPVESVLACTALLDNLAELNEDWVVLADGAAQARLELSEMRICVDLGSRRDAMFIWLTPDRARVVDITGHPQAAAWGLRQFPVPGLLCEVFVEAAQPPQPLRIHTSAPPRPVTAGDVSLLLDIADIQQHKAHWVWNTSAKRFRLPPSLVPED